MALLCLQQLAAAEEGEVDYSKLKVVELRELCGEHGLETKGVKATPVGQLTERQEERARKRARVEPVPDVEGVLTAKKAVRNFVVCADVWSIILRMAF
ncbi:hypothetical protein TeGR_g5421 [Tetraparma gracilis]|uniref:SAP domain-containing protein n=1 Tax=Tetraparma gracilis TaxID=2962635 RepID=A0ABQ6M5Z9_9STRA|nr:hypothetical protein TeGR_g5421 [Tetraparma gracilis]